MTNSGSANVLIINGNWAFYSGSLHTLMIPAAVTSGYSTNESAAVLAIDNPLCGPSVGTSSGWKLKAITNAAAGLPNTLTPPLTLVTS